MRNLLILILGLIIFWWLRRRWKTFSRRGGTTTTAMRPHTRTPERMLACEYCKVHVPEGEGVEDGGHFFCCDEHRRLVGKR